jgi:thioredoxin reductase (NADPH)
VTSEIHDCLIVGAGPAGLTAATYLARFQRRVGVLSAGPSRAHYIPVSHNCPGFPFGISGSDLVQRLREQAAHYGVCPIETRVESITRDDGGFRLHAAGETWRARSVLLASGIRDKLPAFADAGPAELEQAIHDGVLRICAVCDAYEAQDHRIAVVGPAASAPSHACFLRTYSHSVTLILSEAGTCSATDRERLEALSIGVLPPGQLLLRRDAGDRFTSCRYRGAEVEATFDTLYPVLGASIKAELATMLGARTDGNGELLTDPHQQTSIDGLYAAGDVVSALNQISVAVGHAAIAASAIHARLPRNPK